MKSMLDKVFDALLKNPELRDDDFKLIADIYANHYDVKYTSFYDVMQMHKAWGLPSFESIRRSRQKIQEEFPDLRGTKKIDDARIEKQKEYIELAAWTAEEILRREG